METKDINKKNLAIATKAIEEVGIAVLNVVNALKEVVTNRGGEIVFKKKYEFVLILVLMEDTLGGLDA